MGTSTELAHIHRAIGKVDEPIHFVELLGRSNFSFLQGASHPEEMVEQALRLGYQGISLCDLNGLYGVVRGFQTSTAPSELLASVDVTEGFRYSFGTELTLIDETSLVLTPLTKQGYSNLCSILTVGKRQAQKGFSRLSFEDIKPFHQDLLCFALPPITDERFLKLKKIFEDRLYIPVWRDFTWESREFYKQALRIEKEYEAQLFATNRPVMHVPERKPLFDVITCIHHNVQIENAKDILIQNAERHLKPLEELRELWRDRLDLLQVTGLISERIEFSLDQIRYRYPQSHLPEGKNATQYLRHLTEQGLAKIYNGIMPEDVRKVMDHELKIIQELEYEDYFLTLKEICDFAKDKGILFQGRGSAANSVVCFGIGLTAIDPVRMGLLFERFISRERREPPDIDIDFEHERREEVIQHIYEKYGETHAAMVCTVIRYKTRMSIRETAKVFGIPLETVNKMIKFMGRDGMARLNGGEEVREKFKIDPKVWLLFLSLAQSLKGFPRHLGIHTGGFLITQDPINQMVPVEKASMHGRYVIQWNKDDADFLKLMKIDLLSLGMLTALRKCFQMLKEHKGIDWNLSTVPAEDKATYEMCCKAETVGVFQIESRAQMNCLPRLLPKNFYDLVVEIAIVRPGPLQGGMVHPYLKRRGMDPKLIPYPHPELRPILEKTMGIPIFQEQVMKIVVAIAGFTPGEADELRRIMSQSWRKHGTMEAIESRLFRGMREHGVSDDYAQQIFNTIKGFASYGFPESHSASFAILTYAGAYLKRHHPEVFVCGLLNSQPMGFYPPRALISEAQKNKVQFLALDVQTSNYDYKLEKTEQDLAVRVGLRSIFGVPEKLMKIVEEERNRNGVFKNLKDFLQRTNLPKAALMKLTAAGAFQCFETNVRQMLWDIEALSLDNNSFLWGEARESFIEEDVEEIRHESNWETVSREYDHKGFSIEFHPMKIIRSWIEEKNQNLRQQKYVLYSHSADTKNMKNKQNLRVAGLVGIVQKPPTAKGMCFITLEDEFGFMNVVIDPEVYQKYREAIYASSLLEICGKLERRGDLINIKATQVHALMRSRKTFPVDAAAARWF
jgi:DNA-directed DNA polymerase III PolC